MSTDPVPYITTEGPFIVIFAGESLSIYRNTLDPATEFAALKSYTSTA